MAAIETTFRGLCNSCSVAIHKGRRLALPLAFSAIEDGVGADDSP
jgi:RNA polymerase-binding transcription factor DksA